MGLLTGFKTGARATEPGDEEDVSSTKYGSVFASIQWRARTSFSVLFLALLVPPEVDEQHRANSDTDHRHDGGDDDNFGLDAQVGRG